MALRIFIYITIFIRFSSGALNEPFANGFFAASMGTVVDINSYNGSQPWISSAFCNKDMSANLYLFGTDYYDKMDNFEGSTVRQAGIGYTFSRRFLTLKYSYKMFNALDIYYENEHFLSASTRILKYVLPAFDLSIIKMMIKSNYSDHYICLKPNLSFVVPFGLASVSLTTSTNDINEIGSKKSINKHQIGIHTYEHRFGSQGFRAEIYQYYNGELLFNFALGQSISLSKNITMTGGISTNPLMVSIGINFGCQDFKTGFAMVHHPILGWSKSIAGYYTYK